MNFGIKEEAGAGGLLLGIYFHVLLEFVPLTIETKTQLILSFTPVVLLLVVLDSLNNSIMVRIAGKDFFDEVHEDLRDEIGDERFYYDHEEKQEKIDELDRKSVRKVFTIITGLILIPTLPLAGFYRYDLAGLIAGSVIALLVYYIFVDLQRQGLRKVIKEVLRLYD